MEITEAVLDADADYCLAVKGNQPTLHRGVAEYFDQQIEAEFEGAEVETFDSAGKGHGRTERRRGYVCPVPKDLPDAGRWPGLAAIGMMILSSVRGGKESVGIHYYILSKCLNAGEFAAAVPAVPGGTKNLLNYGARFC